MGEKGHPQLCHSLSPFPPSLDKNAQLWHQSIFSTASQVTMAVSCPWNLGTRVFAIGFFGVSQKCANKRACPNSLLRSPSLEALTSAGHWSHLSWFHRRTKEQHLLAPCKRDMWMIASASHQCSVHGRYADRAGTGWGLHIQNPSYRSHTLWFSFLMALNPDQRFLWEGAELVQSAVLFGSAPLPLVGWQDVPGWALGDILESVHVPRKSEEWAAECLSCL